MKKMTNIVEIMLPRIDRIEMIKEIFIKRVTRTRSTSGREDRFTCSSVRGM